MSDAETVVAKLVAKFPSLAGRVNAQRATRVWVDVDRQAFDGVFHFLVKDLEFSNLCMITGLDEGVDLGFIYHLARNGGVMANVKTRCPKGESMQTITPTFPGASIYEREVEDLLGAHIEGLPEGRHYPLPDNWPKGEHPLLKDWKPREKGAQDA
jgi:membrane-bound hydrogenase subunit beta